VANATEELSNVDKIIYEAYELLEKNKKVLFFCRRFL